jgi:hypothetical protein
MVQRSQQLRFARETGHALGIASQCFRQDLDGYIATEFAVLATINPPMPPAPISATIS